MAFATALHKMFGNLDRRVNFGSNGTLRKHRASPAEEDPVTGTGTSSKKKARTGGASGSTNVLASASGATGTAPNANTAPETTQLRSGCPIAGVQCRASAQRFSGESRPSDSGKPPVGSLAINNLVFAPRRLHSFYAPTPLYPYSPSPPFLYSTSRGHPSIFSFKIYSTNSGSPTYFPNRRPAPCPYFTGGEADTDILPSSLEAQKHYNKHYDDVVDFHQHMRHLIDESRTAVSTVMELVTKLVKDAERISGPIANDIVCLPEVHLATVFTMILKAVNPKVADNTALLIDMLLYTKPVGPRMKGPANRRLRKAGGSERPEGPGMVRNGIRRDHNTTGGQG
ncbi:hypothetical protein DFH07DRAFT_765739 [Mycena maculata]|uniref:Uncharacterized protein n=1 Tax=Mycena maculata TaxID=230809 RepID=A0AAD7KB59_9AGAR|nr:hypothetical protein DFH07DRAFT_765739 [Mycena maculata]